MEGLVVVDSRTAGMFSGYEEVSESLLRCEVSLGTSSPYASLTWHIEQCQVPYRPDTRCWKKTDPGEGNAAQMGPIIGADKEDRPSHLGVSRDLSPVRAVTQLSSAQTCLIHHVQGQRVLTGRTFIWDPWAEISQHGLIKTRNEHG